MGLKIATQLKLIKSTNKARLFEHNNQRMWIPKAAIIDMKASHHTYTIVVEDWCNVDDTVFRSVTLSEILQIKPPPNIQFTTGIAEHEFPQDLVAVQVEAVAFAVQLRRCLIWLWTGCGKTKIAIEIANILFKAGRIKRLYWITPQADRAAEQLTLAFAKWLNPSIQVKVVSIHWFSYHTDQNISQTDCVIIDECHRIKNGIIVVNESPECQLANHIRLSIQNAGYIYGLTATTCINGILDLFGIFFCLDKRIIIEPDRKVSHYLVVKNNTPINVKSMLQFLQSVAPYIFHRNKQDYDPRRVIQQNYPLFLSASQSSTMNTLYNRSKTFIKAEPSLVDVYSHMNKCAYKVGGAKIKQNKLQQIIQIIPAEDQIIIFGFTVKGKYADLTLIRESVADLNQTYIELSGERNQTDNYLAIHLFRQNKRRILIASYGCGAEMLDFPNANHVIIFGHSLNPIHRFQAIGRIDRINQKKQCYVYILTLQNSVEGYINHLYEKKIELTSDVSAFMQKDSFIINNNQHEVH